MIRRERKWDNDIIYMTEVKQFYYVKCVSLCTGIYSTFCCTHSEHLQHAPQCVNTHQLLVLERGVMQLLCTGVNQGNLEVFVVMTCDGDIFYICIIIIIFLINTNTF